MPVPNIKLTTHAQPADAKSATAQTSDVVDTHRARGGTAFAVLFLVVAMWGGYTAISLPPVVIVEAPVLWHSSSGNVRSCGALDPSLILPLFLLTVAALDGTWRRNIWRGSVRHESTVRSRTERSC
jgi:hypothetical protein